MYKWRVAYSYNWATELYLYESIRRTSILYAEPTRSDPCGRPCGGHSCTDERRLLLSSVVLLHDAFCRDSSAAPAVAFSTIARALTLAPAPAAFARHATASARALSTLSEPCSALAGATHVSEGSMQRS